MYVEETGEVQTISDAKPFDIVCAELCGQGPYDKSFKDGCRNHSDDRAFGFREVR